MSLDIGEALSEGVRRTVSPAGLALAVAFVAIGAVAALASQTLLADVLDGIVDMMQANRGPGEDEFTRQDIRAVRTLFEGQTPLALGVSPSVAGLLIALTAVLAEAARLLTARVCFPGRTGDGDGAGRVLWSNLPLATVNGIAGDIVVSIIVTIGTVLGSVLLLVGAFVVGGFLAMSLLFLRQEIAVEDKNFVDAMGDSWSLAKGNRIELFALVFLVVVIAGVVVRVPTTVAALISPTAGAVVGVLVGGVTAVFGTAVITRAYAQLHAERHGESVADADGRTGAY